MTATPLPARPAHRDALLLVDLQRDFLPGGSCPVPGGDRVLLPLAACLLRCVRLGWPVFLARDWHPPDHCSFTPAGGRWPAHCVAGTAGAGFADALPLPRQVQLASKGSMREIEPRSSFDHTDLLRRLRQQGVQRLYLGGLGTEAAVLYTALDARRHGFAVRLIADGLAARDLRPGDGARALTRMCESGAVLTSSSELVAAAAA